MRNWFTRPNIEWAVDLWLRFRGNRLTRHAGLLILAALAALSNAVQLLIVGGFALLGRKIEITDTPNWIVVFLVVAAVVLLVVDRLVPPRRGMPNKHDIKLYRKFHKQFPDYLKTFLKEHNFGDDWQDQRTNPLFNFECEWRGARYKFQDKDLDEALTLVKENCRQLAAKISEYSGMARSGVPRMTVKTEMDRIHGLSKQTLAHIKELNAIASGLYAAIDKVDDLARSKLT